MLNYVTEYERGFEREQMRVLILWLNIREIYKSNLIILDCFWELQRIILDIQEH